MVHVPNQVTRGENILTLITWSGIRNLYVFQLITVPVFLFYMHVIIYVREPPLQRNCSNEQRNSWYDGNTCSRRCHSLTSLYCSHFITESEDNFNLKAVQVTRLPIASGKKEPKKGYELPEAPLSHAVNSSQWTFWSGTLFTYKLRFPKESAD